MEKGYWFSLPLYLMPTHYFHAYVVWDQARNRSLWIPSGLHGGRFDGDMNRKCGTAAFYSAKWRNFATKHEPGCESEARPA